MCLNQSLSCVFWINLINMYLKFCFRITDIMKKKIGWCTFASIKVKSSMNAAILFWWCHLEVFVWLKPRPHTHIHVFFFNNILPPENIYVWVFLVEMTAGRVGFYILPDGRTFIVFVYSEKRTWTLADSYPELDPEPNLPSCPAPVWSISSVGLEVTYPKSFF